MSQFLPVLLHALLMVFRFAKITDDQLKFYLCIQGNARKLLKMKELTKTSHKTGIMKNFFAQLGE